ncbi:MAG: hypothetical protein JOZ58_13695 [Acetobacteraceae bacterium]|nr:hypothetical protein [Acetobacteraceae bacterium]MBV8576072.1 hypothetical protein [Acetobacteraceae bacterium]
MTGTDVATYARERPGRSTVVLEDGAIYHIYSTFARGRRTVSPIRQKFALLISNTNLDDPRFARFQRLSDQSVDF